MIQYFRMLDDVHVPGRWFLADPVDRHGAAIDYMLTDGVPLQIEGPIRLHFNEFAKTRGNPIDYCEIDAVGATPIVHVRVAALLSRLAPTDVQIFPVIIEGRLDQFCLVT